MPSQIRRSDFPPQPCPVEQQHPGFTSGEDHNKALDHDPKKSGATKEAAVSKSAEHKIAGRAQEAKLRDFQNPTVLVNGKPVEAIPNDHKHDPEFYESAQGSPTVSVNGKSPVRKGDHVDHCDNSQTPIK